MAFDRAESIERGIRSMSTGDLVELRRLAFHCRRMELFLMVEKEVKSRVES